MLKRTAFRLLFLAIAITGSNLSFSGSLDPIFADRFEPNLASINCPTASPLPEKVNEFGGIIYQAFDAIDPAGDIDFYSAPISAGDWVQIVTSANPSNDPELLDTVVTIFTSDGSEQLARSDDATPRSGPDSELYYRAIDDGSLCISVEDYSTAALEPPEGGPTFIYGVRVTPLDFDLYDGLTLDTEENDTVGSAQTGLSYFEDAQTQQLSTGIAGYIDDAGDRDVYLLSTPPMAVGASVLFTPNGSTGYGSTIDLGIVELIDSDGSTVIGRLDYGNGSAGLQLPVNPDDTYYLIVDTPPGPAGANPFYFLKYSTQDEQNPQETDDTGNGTFAGAEVAPALPEIMGRISHFFGGALSGTSDMDWWSFEASAGDSVAVFCASRRQGSGVLDMTVRLWDDPAGPFLQTETEMATQDLSWTALGSQPSVPINTTGTHYLSLSAFTFSPEVTDRHYQCGIHVLLAP